MLDVSSRVASRILISNRAALGASIGQWNIGLPIDAVSKRQEHAKTLGQFGLELCIRPVTNISHKAYTMPKEHRKRGRREEKKRKREENEYEEPAKRSKSQEAEEVEGATENIDENGAGYDEQNGAVHEEPYASNLGLGNLPYYGILDEEEQEYFKRADSMLELNQFADPEERNLFLANVYKEANGKELKIANSQSCSRLMERLISLSTPSQLKALFQKFSGQ